METVNKNYEWLPDKIADDLRNTGIFGVCINPPIIVEDKYRYPGFIVDSTVTLVWKYKRFFSFTMDIENPKLVKAFSKILEYEPFLRYEDKGFITYEWSKRPQIRLKILREKKAYLQLQFLQEEIVK